MSDWHVEAHTLRRYAEGSLSDSAAWSVEAHVTCCQACRDRIGDVDLPTVDYDLDTRVDAIWSEVRFELDRGRRPVEWLLERAGVPEHVARLLAATPALTASWLLSVAAVLTFAAAAAWWAPAAEDPLSSRLLFLLVAPLAPMAGIAAAFGPRVDPTYEIGMAAPLRSGKLLFIRAVAVLSSSLVLTALAALLLPGLDWTVAAWVMPALAAAALALALSTVVEPVIAAGGVAVAWLGVATFAEVSSSTSLVAFRAEGQVAAVVVLGVATMLLAMRRQRFDTQMLT